MSATFRSNVPAFVYDLREAEDAALKEAAKLLKAAVVERLQRGFTTGLFVTGKMSRSVKTSDVTTEDGVRVIRVGTDDFRAPFYEFGHMNRFTRTFVRVPVWRPMAVNHSTRIGSVITATLRTRLRRWKHDPSVHSFAGGR